jgi:2-C-methyl-D-erythritol 4-phosphate cytidylyltransferase
VVFESNDGVSSCVSTEREKLFRTQTPHTYRLGELYSAHIEAQKRGIINTAASCMLMKELGKMTYFSKGSEENLKITTLDDLKIFKALLYMTQDSWIK